MNRCYLFDGAILAEHALTTAALDTPDAVCLYSDLGEEAARVGPILVPDTPSALALANKLINAEDSRRFAASLIIHPVRQEALVEHLFQLRYIHTTHEESKRYFLRYADTRVLQSLCQVAAPAQLYGLLGPIQRWNWVVPDKTFHELKTPSTWDGVTAGLPLRLSPDQLSGFLRQCRYHELLHITLTHDPSLVKLGSLAERHAWTQQTERWLRQQGIRHGGIQIAVNEAVWRTRGDALAADDFAKVARQAEDHSRPQIIQDWLATHTNKGSA